MPSPVSPCFSACRGSPVAPSASQVVERRPWHQVSVRGVHRHHTMLDLLEERHRIEAADDGVRRVMLHAEVRRVDLLDDLEENVFRLRELG